MSEDLPSVATATSTITTTTTTAAAVATATVTAVVTVRVTSAAAAAGATISSHPLAREVMKQDEMVGTAAAAAGIGSQKRYVVWRRQQLRFVGMNERVIAIDGEYVYIMPSSGGKTASRDGGGGGGGGKTTTVHFSNVVGCSVSRRHPMNFKVSEASFYSNLLFFFFFRFF